MTRLLRIAAAWLLAVLAGGALAHEMTTAEMQVRELPDGRYFWAWGLPGRDTPIEQELQIHWPEACKPAADERVIDCGPAGLDGTVSVDGLGKNYAVAILNIAWKSGEPRGYTLTPRRPQVRLFGGPNDAREAGEIAWTYAQLGVEHILSGWDHLLFVLGLLFLVGFRRRLVATITAFTVAHSITLAASALGALSLRSPPVEATIALSIVLVALEALRERETLARRWPALVAFLFGLVHGLGFAGALAEIGLPHKHANIALLTFNVGVEAGQLLVVGLAWAAMLAIGRWPRVQAARRPVLYAIGALAAYWTIARLAAFG